MEAEFSHELVAALEELIWSLPAEQLSDAEPAFRALFGAVRCDLPAALAEMSDESLVLAVRKAFLRNWAFEELLVRRYEKAILGWFFQRTANRDQAQELTQELYLKFLSKGFETFKENSLFYPWLWAAVRNAWTTEWRRSKTQVELPALDRSFSGLTPLEELECRETENRVNAIVCELPAEQRRVLQLAMEGEKPGGIAKELHLSQKKVYQLLFKARRHIRQALAPVLEPKAPRRAGQVESDNSLERVPPL